MELCLSLLQRLEDQHKVKFLTSYMLQHLAATLPQDELEDLRLRRIGAKVRFSNPLAPRTCMHAHTHAHTHTHTCTHGGSEAQVDWSKGGVFKPFGATHMHACTHTCTHAHTHMHTWRIGGSGGLEQRWDLQIL